MLFRSGAARCRADGRRVARGPPHDGARRRAGARYVRRARRATAGLTPRSHCVPRARTRAGSRAARSARGVARAAPSALTSARTAARFPTTPPFRTAFRHKRTTRALRVVEGNDMRLPVQVRGAPSGMGFVGSSGMREASRRIPQPRAAPQRRHETDKPDGTASPAAAQHASTPSGGGRAVPGGARGAGGGRRGRAAFGPLSGER